MKDDMTLDDARLARQLARTLDRAAADPAHDAVLDAMVARALRPAPARRWHLSGGLALAASVAFMAVLPVGWSDLGGSPQAVGSAAVVDGQMVEEIDWLLSMEEASRGR